MKAVIRSSTVRASNAGRSVAYVECPISSLIDKEFFNKHKIYNLNFKCVTWNAVKRTASKYARQALQTLYPTATISYSAKAGCSCGCSPGYIITHRDTSKSQDMWVDLSYEDSVLDKVRDELVKFEAQLQREIFAHQESEI